MEQMARMNPRQPPFVNSQGGKRRAVDSSVGDGPTTGGGAGGGSSLEDAHRLFILGFHDRLMATTLERVAKGTISRCATVQAA
eukprot:6025082-Pyramimonas_sp.AAC.1